MSARQRKTSLRTRMEIRRPSPDARAWARLMINILLDSGTMLETTDTNYTSRTYAQRPVHEFHCFLRPVDKCCLLSVINDKPKHSIPE